MPGEGLKVAIDADPQLGYRRSIQSADHGIQFQPYLVCVVLRAEEWRHMGVGVDIEDNRIPYFINDTGAALILHRNIEVISGSGRYGNIALSIRDGQKSIECQVKEMLRNASVRQGNLRLYGR